MAQDTSAVREAAISYLRKKGVPATGANLQRAMKLFESADTPLKSFARPTESDAKGSGKSTKKKSKSKSTGKKVKDAGLPIPPKKPTQGGASARDYGYNPPLEGDASDDSINAMPGMMEGGAAGAALLAALMRRKKQTSRPSGPAMGLEGEILRGQPVRSPVAGALEGPVIDADYNEIYGPERQLTRSMSPMMLEDQSTGLGDVVEYNDALPGTARAAAMEGGAMSVGDPYYDMSMLGGGTGVRGGMLPSARSGPSSMIEALMEKKLQQQMMANSTRGGGGGYPRQPIDPSLGTGPDAATDGVTRTKPTPEEIDPKAILRAIMMMR